MSTSPKAKQVAEHCPHCPDQGWYVQPDRNTGEPTQVQCDWCNSTPNSVYNRSQQPNALLVAENERLLAAISQAGAEMVLGNDSRAMRILDAALTGTEK